jgi:signal peptide peptidase SppA
MPRNPALAKADHVLAFVLDHPWALTESMRAVLANVLARRLVGLDADPVGVQVALDARRDDTEHVPMATRVAVIPLRGVIAPRMNLFSDISGGTTFEGLTQDLDDALTDPSVETIVFDVDSPGGNVAGAHEFARAVLNGRARKPIIAQLNHMGASAAYWAMSGATEIVATPSALVGSIGVFGIYDDLTAALEQLGIKRTVISAGKYKAEGVGGSGLSAEAAAHQLHLIEGAYGRFVGDVAKGRGVSTSAVRNGYGEGRAVDADMALELGLVDRIATLAETLARVTTPATAGTRGVAEQPPTATGQEPTPSATPQERSAAAAADQRELLARVRVLEAVAAGYRP